MIKVSNLCSEKRVRKRSSGIAIEDSTDLFFECGDLSERSLGVELFFTLFNPAIGLRDVPDELGVKESVAQSVATAVAQLFDSVTPHRHLGYALHYEFTLEVILPHL